MSRLVVVLLAAVLLAGCGGGGGGSTKVAGGAGIFTANGCAGCHTLSAVKAEGQVGPNLDALKPEASTVARQVRVGGNGMPSFAGKLSNRQIIEVAQFVAEASRRSTAVAFRADGTTLADCEPKEEQSCLRQAFANLAYRQGPTKALGLLASADGSNAAVHTDCHQITHAIGHASLARFRGNTAEALAQGQMTCNSGYYHGVIELALGGVPRSKVVGLARKMCASPALAKSDFLLYQCVHGLGHGLMIYSGDDLPFSLKVCDELPTAFERESCPGGVFMQNLMPGMGTSSWLREDNPLYPCAIVASRHKYYCYLESTSLILPHVNWDWAKASDWCLRAEPRWVAICFQSLGRDATGFTHYKAAETASVCLKAGSGAADCIYGAARDYGNNYAGGSQAVEFCSHTPARYRGRCIEGVGTILGALHRYRAGRVAACRAVTPKAYLGDCLRGAAVT